MDFKEVPEKGELFNNKYEINHEKAQVNDNN